MRHQILSEVLSACGSCSSQEAPKRKRKRKRNRKGLCHHLPKEVRGGFGGWWGRAEKATEDADTLKVACRLSPQNASSF